MWTRISPKWNFRKKSHVEDKNCVGENQDFEKELHHRQDFYAIVSNKQVMVCKFENRPSIFYVIHKKSKYVFDNLKTI